jgi:hypothetical protein
MAPVRGFVVWGVGMFAVLIPFLIFVSVGWPAHPDRCTNIVNHVQVEATKKVDGVTVPDPKHPDTCYCEAFSVEKVDSGAKGIRQPVNTLSNIYAIFSSLVLVFLIRRDRAKAMVYTVSKNLFHDPDSWVPEVYVFAVLFLGLGSMWFHASLSSTVSWFDGMSMYVFAAFLPIYTIRRRFDIGIFFYAAYAVTVIVFTFMARILDRYVDKISMIFIIILVAIYVLLEFVGVKVVDRVRAGSGAAWRRNLRQGAEAGWLWPAIFYWAAGAVSFGLAVAFQVSSQTGYPLCHPFSRFQPHGLLWHTLSGQMAVFLYLYWRKLPDRDANLPWN